MKNTTKSITAPKALELNLIVSPAGTYPGTTKGNWDVRVWFATSSGYRTVMKSLTLEAAQAEARAYLSDAVGVQLRSNSGGTIDLKTARASEAR